MRQKWPKRRLPRIPLIRKRGKNANVSVLADLNWSQVLLTKKLNSLSLPSPKLFRPYLRKPNANHRLNLHHQEVTSNGLRDLVDSETSRDPGLTETADRAMENREATASPGAIETADAATTEEGHATEDAETGGVVAVRNSRGRNVNVR